VGDGGRGPVGPCGRCRQVLFDYHPEIRVLVPARGAGAGVMQTVADGTATVPLGDVAEIRYVRGPEMIRSENTFPVAYVTFGGAPGMAEANNVQEMLINKAVWDKLEPANQEIIRSAVMESLLRSSFFFKRIDAEAYRVLTGKQKVQVRRTPRDILTKTLEVWDTLAEQESARNPFFKKVLESQRNYAALIVPYRVSVWPPYELAAGHYWQKAIFRR
jgi:hypothetical protein